jgi:non-heme chloroperoxidase
MDRRYVLKSVVAAAAGSGLMAATEGGEATAKSSPPRGVTRITTKDGTALYYRDWGDGPTLLFLHSMAVNSDMWHYQIGPFVEQGFR